MGIPNYFYHVLTNHKGIIKKLYFHKIDNLYLDSNSLIYDTIYEFENPITNENIIYEIVYKKIEELRVILKPSGITFVSFDGVAPLAKLIQQKERRYKSNLIKEVLSKPTTSWNTNNITPGTKFMKNLNIFMKNKYKNVKNVIYSGSDEPGEGEHKICHYIRNNYSVNNHENHCIYGLDADLIMLGLLLVRNKYNIFLYRETKHFSYIPKIDKDENYLFDLQRMSEQLKHRIHKQDNIVAINEYILLCFLCGNDFMPHFSSINIRNEGVQYLINTYNCANPPLRLVSENNTIDWRELHRLFHILSKEEETKTIENIHWKIQKSKAIRVKNAEEKLNALPLYDKEKEIYILNNMEDYDEIVFETNSPDKPCNNYLEMLEWTWNYYNGNVKDHYLYYNFSHAPRFENLKKFTPVFSNHEILELQTNQEMIDDQTQLLFVLPYEDHDKHFSQEFRDNVYSRFPQLKDSNFEVDYLFCKYFWESTVDINYVNFHSLNKYVKSIK